MANQEITGINKRPAGVLICSIIYYIITAFYIITPIYLMFTGGGFAAIAGVMSLIFGIPFAILFFLVAYNLTKGKNWAKIVAIVFAILGIVGGAYNILSPYEKTSMGIIYLIVAAFVAGYLLFNKKAKEFFS